MRLNTLEHFGSLVRLVRLWNGFLMFLFILCVFIGKYGAIKTFFYMFSMQEKKAQKKNPRRIDCVLDFAVAEVAIQLYGSHLCLFVAFCTENFLK